MSARDPPNLRRWVEWGIKKAGKQAYRRKFWVDMMTWWHDDSTINIVWSQYLLADVMNLYSAQALGLQDFKVKKVTGTIYSS